MPSFKKYIDVIEYVDIHVDEFLTECDNEEIQEVIEYLKRNGHLDDPASAEESFFEDAVHKLHGSWNRLTKEQEDTIRHIANTL